MPRVNPLSAISLRLPSPEPMASSHAASRPSVPAPSPAVADVFAHAFGEGLDTLGHAGAIGRDVALFPDVGLEAVEGEEEPLRLLSSPAPGTGDAVGLPHDARLARGAFPR